MTEKIYKVQCIDGKLYLVHHGISDYIGVDNGNINEKAIIQISHYLNEQEKRIKELEKEKYKLNSKVKRLIDELANCYEKLGW